MALHCTHTAICCMNRTGHTTFYIWCFEPENIMPGALHHVAYMVGTILAKEMHIVYSVQSDRNKVYK